MIDIREEFFEETMPSLASMPSSDLNLKRENGNIDGDTAMGTMLRFGSEAAKAFYKTNIEMMSTEAAEAHDSGDIHVHDLDFNHLTTTCCQIDLGDLLKRGFDTGHGSLRPPTTIGTAAAQAAIVIQSNQNDQHGGQSIPAFDYALAPYVGRSFVKNLCYILDVLDYDPERVDAIKRIVDRWAFEQDDDRYHSLLSKDGRLIVRNALTDCIWSISEGGAVKLIDKAIEKTEKDTYQAMEGFLHNLNTMHSRAGAQVPFSSINYGTDTSMEGRMVIRNVLQAEEAGLGHGETPIFPIHIFKVRNGKSANPGDMNYDLFKMACMVSAKRLFPNFSFMDAPFNKQFLTDDGDPDHEVAYMGCRTRVMGNRCGSETTFGRGNLSFTSINLPRIALKHRGDIDGFFDELNEKLELVYRQLLDRYNLQGKRTVRNVPFLMGQHVWKDSDKLNIDDKIGGVLKHGTLTVGFIGLAECLKALIGKHHGESDQAQELGLKIVGFIREKTDEKGEETGLNFSVIATPAEGLSGRFVEKDKKVFGIIPEITDREYYTNSFHVPVYYDINAFRKIKLEAPYHKLTNGGHISYVELDGDPTKNVQGFIDIVKFMGQCGMGYGSINHAVDHDPVCGFTGIIGDSCPRCHRKESDGKGKFERIRRITGYLVGTLDRFNNGKRAEERDRVKHPYIRSI